MSKLGKREPNKIFRLEELYDEINDVLENDIVLSGVRVKAEVSSYKMYPSGHIYITLVEKASQKDKDGKRVKEEKDGILAKRTIWSTSY